MGPGHRHRLCSRLGAIPRIGAVRRIVWCSLLVSGLALCWASLGHALQINDLQRPQSFVADAPGTHYFISNANGDPDAKDNNGFITKLETNGTIVALRFIQGGANGVVLHAPKGMAVADSILYVADLEAVRAFDSTTGKPLRTVSLSRYGTVGLADVAVGPNGMLYTSDTKANRIFQIDPARHDAVSVLVQDDALAGPSGLAIHPRTGHLIAVSWAEGKILDVDPGGALVELVSNSWFSFRFYNLSGVDFDQFGNMYVSDFTAGKVWRMHPDGTFKVIAEFLHSPADLAVDRNNHVILVPYLYANSAEINGLEMPSSMKKTRKRTLADYGFPFMKPKDQAQPHSDKAQAEPKGSPAP